MRTNDLSDDEQTEPQSSILTNRDGTREAIEDVRQMLGRDADAVVTHRYAGTIAVSGNSHFDQLPSSKLECVGVNAGYVNQWIAARAGIGSEPADCAPFPTGQTCQTPPNDL